MPTSSLPYQSPNLPVFQSTRLPVCHYRSAVPNATKTSQGVTVSCGPSYADQAQARLMPTLDDGWPSASTVQLFLCLARKHTAAWLVDGLPPVFQDPNRM